MTTPCTPPPSGHHLPPRKPDHAIVEKVERPGPVGGDATLRRTPSGEWYRVPANVEAVERFADDVHEAGEAWKDGEDRRQKVRDALDDDAARRRIPERGLVVDPKTLERPRTRRSGRSRDEDTFR